MKKRKLTNYLQFIVLCIGISFLQMNCQKDDFEFEDTSMKKNDFPYQIQNKTLNQLKSNSKFNSAIKATVNKGKSNYNGKTIMEDEYGFSLDSTFVKEISSDNYTSYTFFIHRDEVNDAFFENLVVEIDSTNIPEAYIVKYTPNSESVYLYEDDSYTFDSEIEITSITYNANELKVTNGDCVGILMCPWGSDHPAGQACIDANRTGEDALYLDDSMCDESSGGGGDGGSSSGDGSPSGDGSSGSSGGGGSGDGSSDPNTDTTACKACGDSNEVITSPIIKDEIEEEILVDDDCRINDSVFNQLYALYSPFNVDLSEVRMSCNSIDTISVVENAKFMCIYSKLVSSPKFKNLFIDTFGESENLNVKFEVVDDLPSNTRGLTVADPSNPSTLVNGVLTLNLIIKINSDNLDSNSIAADPTIEIAKTIIHECIHAFLYVKKYNCNDGTTIDELNNQLLGELLNEYYDGLCSEFQEQHEFMFDYMLPTMADILEDIKDDLIPESNQSYVSDLDYNNSLVWQNNPLTERYIFNWDDFYKNICLSGLHNTNAFQQEIASNTIKDYLYRRYTSTSKQFSKNYCNE